MFSEDASAPATGDSEAPLLAAKLDMQCADISPQTMTKIIQRMKALALRLLPMQVEEDELTSPTSSIITKEVVEAFRKAAGTFAEAAPFALLEARRSFYKDAMRDPSDYDENLARKTACEALARKVVQTFAAEDQPAVLLTRFQRVESDGDISLPTSALESAVDQHCPFFLSSNDAQRCTYALWEGHLVQEEAADGHIVFQIYKKAASGSFMDHFDSQRLAVPRYQNWLKIFLWLIFIVCFTIAVQTPEREFGAEDIILHVQLFGYIWDDLIRVWKIGIVAATDFWFLVNWSIYALLLTALGYRLADLSVKDDELAIHYRRLSFYILSCAAPLIWMKVLPIFDLLTYIGTLQIVVRRMLRESVLFFFLLALLAIGFAQALTGLDASDQTPGDSTSSVARSLIEGLLGSPGFDLYDRDAGSIQWPFGLIIYYFWCFFTIVLLLNVLVALFNSAYESITEDAVSQYMAFFTAKVVASVRAPDQYVYVAPFNLIEFFILPLEFILSKQAYGTLNRFLLRVLFFPALFFIALFESRFDAAKVRKMRNALIEDSEDYDENPEVDDTDKKNGTISTTHFDELTKSFPDLTSSASSTILKEIKSLSRQLKALEEKYQDLGVKQEK